MQDGQEEVHSTWYFLSFKAPDKSKNLCVNTISYLYRVTEEMNMCKA